MDIDNSRQGYMMSLAISKFVLNWKKIGAVLVLASVTGCEGSEYAKRVALEEGKTPVQYYGEPMQPDAVTVRWQKLDSNLMHSVCKHKSLTELRLVTSERDGAAVLSHVSQLSQLRTLQIIEVALDDSELEELSKLKSLRSLELSRTGITGQGLRYLGKLPLKELVIRENNLSVDGLQAIADMTELEDLELAVPRLQLADLPTLASLDSLRSITIADGNFSYRKYGGLKWLVGAPHLQNLQLSGFNLNDRSLEAIGTLQNLQHLTIEKCSVSEEGVGHIAKLEKLKTVDIPELHSLSSETVARFADRLDQKVAPVPIRG